MCDSCAVETNLGDLPERVARIEATLDAQGDQLDRIEDSLSQRLGGPR